MINNVKDFVLDNSSSSCYIDDIEAFVYGPFTSRFWMLRKHIITMNKGDLAVDAPFLSWNCITLSIKNKWDIYLIIKNETVMTNFLKLLIHKTNSVNGYRDSAIRLKQQRLNLMKSAFKPSELTESKI